MLLAFGTHDAAKMHFRHTRTRNLLGVDDIQAWRRLWEHSYGIPLQKRTSLLKHTMSGMMAPRMRWKFGYLLFSSLTQSDAIIHYPHYIGGAITSARLLVRARVCVLFSWYLFSSVFSPHKIYSSGDWVRGLRVVHLFVRQKVSTSIFKRKQFPPVAVA